MKALVLHGFTGSLNTVRPMAQALEEQGIEVALPILRGHGTSPDHLFRVHWRDWVADARSALLSVAPTARSPVLLVGHSMGALVATVIAAEFPDRVQKLALTAPAFAFRSKLVHLLPVLKHLYRTWSGNPEYSDPTLMHTNTNYLHFPVEAFEQVLALIEVSKDLLSEVQCPVATFCAKRDPIVPLTVSKLIEKRLPGSLTAKHTYKKSYHEVFEDVEAQAIIEDILHFFSLEEV